MQQGRNSSGGQGLADRAAEEQATKRGRERALKPPQGRNCPSSFFAFFAWAFLVFLTYYCSARDIAERVTSRYRASEGDIFRNLSAVAVFGWCVRGRGSRDEGVSLGRGLKTLLQ